MRGYTSYSILPNLPHNIAHFMATTLDKKIFSTYKDDVLVLTCALNDFSLVQALNNAYSVSSKADVE